MSLQLPSPTTFLKPVELLSPVPSQLPHQTNDSLLTWKAIPGVQAYHVRVYGLKEFEKLVVWDAAPNPAKLSRNWYHVSQQEINQALAEHKLLPSSQTQVLLPQELFVDCDLAYLTIIGYGDSIESRSAMKNARMHLITSMQYLWTINQ